MGAGALPVPRSGALVQAGLLRPLGETGTIVFLRLSAFILLCVGVQIIWDGLAGLIDTLR